MAAAVPAGARSVADVGAGDGQLASHLARLGFRVIATEHRPAPLARLRAAAPGLESRLGDGLEPLRPGEVEGVVLAGIGGRSMARILDSAPERARALDWLVLQPQPPVEPLLEWLRTSGHALRMTTTALQGGHSYTVLLVGPHECP